MVSTAAQSFSYVQEWNTAFLSLFAHRFDYIFAPFPGPGQKPNWRTESRHPLSDRIITQSSALFGLRFGPETRYCMLDIDIDSTYHPKQDPNALGRLLQSLEPLGLVRPLICTSSYSSGLHVYFPFSKPQRSWKLASALATLIEAAGFKIQQGQLELFPNTKNYVAAGSPSLFNAHRLPLQEPGSYLLNNDLEPIWSDQDRFVDLWQQSVAHNDLGKVKIRTVLKQQKRTRHFISEKADKFLNDLNAEVEPGWTGKGQTNRLLGRITMRCFIFHHVIAGGLPLNGQALIQEIVETAKSLPGYRTWCRHQHELMKRVTDWVRSIENSHYFPYGTQQGKYKATTPHSIRKPSGWNEQQAKATQQKIQTELERLSNLGQLPDQITQRFQSLTKAGISGSSLYRYKQLWHPKFQTKEDQRDKTLHSSESPPARPEGAANWHNPPSLLCENACNSSDSKDLELLDPLKNESKGRNSLPGKDLGSGDTQDVAITIQKIKAFLAEQPSKPSHTVVEQAEIQQQAKEQAMLAQKEAYLKRFQGYLRSGEPVLVMEALEVLSCQPENLDSPEMATALEAALAAPEIAAEPGRVQQLIRLLLELSRLNWGAERLQRELKQRWQCSRLAELTMLQLTHCYESLQSL